MRRFVSVWLPHFPIERLKRADPALIPKERPFALVAAGARGLTLTAVDERGRRQGLAPGLALADARAAFPALATRPAEPARDAAVLEGLAVWAGRYGPSRNVYDSDGLWIDVTGVAHLYGGEAELLADICRRLAVAGFTARVALAETYGGAHALARYGGGAGAIAASVVAPPGGLRDALASLPVAALRLVPEAVTLLRRLGLNRIGQLYGLPRAALARRFRDAPTARRVGRRQREAQALLAGAVLDRLDQALGHREEPLAGIVEPPAYRVRRDFPEPIAQSAVIEATLAALADELAGLLVAQGHGARRFTLDLYRADGTAASIAIGTGAPAQDGQHVFGLLAEKLACLDAGFGVDALVLAAGRTEPVAARQTTLAGAQACASAVGPLIDRLSNRLGPERVSCLEPVASHRPERAERQVPALRGGRDGTAASRVGPRPPGPPRPPFLLTPPEPITVVAEVPEGPPLRFAWRRVHHAIVRAEGPERIAPEWWRALGREVPPAARDYYRIEDDQGGRYWVFREGLYQAAETEHPPRWFVHGLYG